ncbi:MAG: ferritin-like domain-containing protein [Deltaproteobacteria bacterium]
MKHSVAAALEGSTPALSAVFRQALQLAGVGLSGVALAACGSKLASDTDAAGYLRTGTRSGTFPDEPGFVPTACDPEAYPNSEALPSLDGVQPALAVDAIELWSDAFLRGTGVSCSGATDAADCERRLAELPLEPRFVLGYTVQVLREYHLRATRGDEVLRVGTVPELARFLGAIDSLDDAQLWLASQNYSLICGASGARAVADGSEVLAFTYEGCDGRTRSLLHVGADGALSTLDRFVERAPNPSCIVGRRPEGLRQSAGDLRASLGAFFAHSAGLEAASVPAFLRLARELQRHGAPRSLARRAVAAAWDEVRHARAVGELARAFGGERAPWSLAPGSLRELEAVALENAIEGCVRETYGALVAQYQQQYARDARIAAVYRPIAADEARHAELSWAVARWAEPRLPAAARRRVQAARVAAASELVGQVRSTPAAEHDVVAGLPSPELGLALASQLERVLWRPALCA